MQKIKLMTHTVATCVKEETSFLTLFPMLQFTGGKSLTEPAHQFATWTSASDPHPETLWCQEPAYSPV